MPLSEEEILKLQEDKKGLEGEKRRLLEEIKAREEERTKALAEMEARHRGELMASNTKLVKAAAWSIALEQQLGLVDPAVLEIPGLGFEDENLSGEKGPKKEAIQARLEILKTEKPMLFSAKPALTLPPPPGGNPARGEVGNLIPAEMRLGERGDLRECVGDDGRTILFEKTIAHLRAKGISDMRDYFKGTRQDTTGGLFG